MTVNEDKRRRLTAFREGKLLEIKEDCEVGKHYHKIKTEYFVLCKGEGYVEIINSEEMSISNLIIGELITILPLTNHKFSLKAGSVLIGLCTHPYDPKDDYHI